GAAAGCGGGVEYPRRGAQCLRQTRGPSALPVGGLQHARTQAGRPRRAERHCGESRRPNPRAEVRWRRRRAPSSSQSVDLVRPAAGPSRDGLLAGICAVTVAVTERERRLDLELPLEAGVPLPPPPLVPQAV